MPAASRASTRLSHIAGFRSHYSEIRQFSPPLIGSKPAPQADLRVVQGELDACVVTVIASDAHNIAHRPPRMAEARQAIAQRCGQDAAILLTEINPGRIVGLVSPLPTREAAPA
jgi:hypothetical protein